MLYTITNSGLQNGRPTQIGENRIVVAFGTTHIFTVANFTTETEPPYSDPEGDALSFIKILTLPPSGTLRVNGVDVVLGQLIYVADITTNNFVYVSDASGSYTFQFDAADVGSNSLSGLDTGFIGMEVSPAINLPPDQVGDNTIPADYGDSITFTVADFTSETTPAYNDPEGDPASMVKILTLPSDGTLVFNGVDVIVNQEMTVAEIAAGYLVYNPDLAITTIQSLTFDFAVADAGSGIYTE